MFFSSIEVLIFNLLGYNNSARRCDRCLFKWEFIESKVHQFHLSLSPCGPHPLNLQPTSHHLNSQQPSPPALLLSLPSPPTPSSNPHPTPPHRPQTPAPVSKTSWSLPGSLYCDAFKQFRQHSGENLALASLTGNNHRLDMKDQHTSWVAFYTPTSTRFLGGEGWMSGVGTVFVQLLSAVAVYTPSFTRHFTSRLKGHNQLRWRLCWLLSPS